MLWFLLLSLTVLSLGCSHGEPVAVSQQESGASACRVESDRESYIRGQPILLQVWCSEAPLGSVERSIVDDLMMGKGQLVVETSNSVLQRIDTVPIAAPHRRPGQLGFSCSVQTYGLEAEDPFLELVIRIELANWSSNNVSVSVNRQ